MKVIMYIQTVLLFISMSAWAAPTMVKQIRNENEVVTILLEKNEPRAMVFAQIEDIKSKKSLRTLDLSSVLKLSSSAALLVNYQLNDLGNGRYELKAPAPQMDEDNNNVVALQFSRNKDQIVADKMVFEKWRQRREGSPVYSIGRTEWDFRTHVLSVSTNGSDNESRQKKTEQISNCDFPLMGPRNLQYPKCIALQSHFMEKEVISGLDGKNGHRSACPEIQGEYTCEEFSAGRDPNLFTMYVILREGSTGYTYDLEKMPAQIVADSREYAITGNRHYMQSSCKRDLIVSDVKEFADSIVDSDDYYKINPFLKRHYEIQQLDVDAKKFTFSERNWVVNVDKKDATYTETTNYFYTCHAVGKK